MEDNEKVTQWTMEEIIEWCKANNQVAWLKAEASRSIERKVYPKVQGISEKTGRKVWKMDKSQTPTVEYTRPSFMEIRSAFVDKFISPRKEKKPSIYDLIDAL